MADVFQVEVNNMPEDTLQYIVARRDKNTSGLWYWGSYDSAEQAVEIAKILDGIVVKRTETE